MLTLALMFPSMYPVFLLARAYPLPLLHSPHAHTTHSPHTLTHSLTLQDDVVRLCAQNFPPELQLCDGVLVGVFLGHTLRVSNIFCQKMTFWHVFALTVLHFFSFLSFYILNISIKIRVIINSILTFIASVKLYMVSFPREMPAHLSVFASARISRNCNKTTRKRTWQNINEYGKMIYMRIKV